MYAYGVSHLLRTQKPPGPIAGKCSPATVEDLINSAFDTKSPYTFVFEEAQRRKMLYFCLRWENGKGEKGPWSEIYSAVIP
jgi:hypothetical protein